MKRFRSLILVMLASLGLILAGLTLHGADHWEAPLVDERPDYDLLDIFAFRNPGRPENLVLALDVNPASLPTLNASYFFNRDALYQFKIDTNFDGREDLVIQARFSGTGLAQTVTVKGPASPVITGARNVFLTSGPEVAGSTNQILGPSPEGIRVYAGLRDDPFVVDLAQVNRVLGRRAVHMADRPRDPIDSLEGLNASALIMEFPISLLGNVATTLGRRLVGVWATVSEPATDGLGGFVQIERAGQQVVSTVFVPGALRDAFNLAIPENDLRDFGHLIPDAIGGPDGGGIEALNARYDFLAGAGAFSTAPPLAPRGTNLNPIGRELIRVAVLPDMLRLDIDADPNDLAIGQFGFQNGRRLGDDVVDITFRIARQLFALTILSDPSQTPMPGTLGFDPCTLSNPRCNPNSDPRVNAVLLGTDFIKGDPDLVLGGNERPLGTESANDPEGLTRAQLIQLGFFDSTGFPFFATAHPIPGDRSFPPR